MTQVDLVKFELLYVWMYFLNLKSKHFKFVDPVLLTGLVDIEAFIKELSEHIGIDWKALARKLGLSKTDIDAIEYDNHMSMKDQIFEFFYKWKQREGKDASVQKLIDGLKAANLEEQLKKMHEAGLMPG